MKDKIKDKIDTLKKWFKPVMTKQNIAIFVCSIIVVILIALLGIFVL